MRVWFTVPLIAAMLSGCSMVPESTAGSYRSDDPSLPAESYRSTGAAPAPSPVRALPAPRSQAAGQCLSRLGATGAEYTALPDRYVDQGCTTLGTVQLAGLSSDRASLGVTNLGPVTCEVSQAFAGWARYGVDRAARQLLGSGVRSIETFGSFSCRNVAGTNRRSGHATGMAIDISGFVLDDGRRITVKGGWHGGSAGEREFLRVIQRSACKRFATVLGPDYNSAHHDHLHVEGVLADSSYCR
ncbi:MAG TPA: extensin family protein [Croceibacterium sp.]